MSCIIRTDHDHHVTIIREKQQEETKIVQNEELKHG
jgi:hypothetical protein